MRLKYTFEIMQMDEEFVAVPVGEGVDEFNGMIRLNQSAAQIFALLKEDNTIEGIVETLAQEYEIDKTELNKFVTEYINQLRKDELLIE